jgi:hypothetical protein
VKGMQKDIVLCPGLTLTRSLIQALAHTLPRRDITIYIDNYFTFVPLFEELRSCQFGAVRTTRLYSEFLFKIKEIKDQFSKKLE